MPYRPRLQPDFMNLKTLASHLGISPSTVSRVLSGRGDAFRISKKTQDRILSKARSLGVRPNEVARSLRLSTSHTIGLVIPDISNPFFASLARAVEREARKRGYTVLLADSQESLSGETECVRMLTDRQIDGLILAPVGGHAGHLKSLLSGPMPVVQVDRALTQLRTPSVVADNFSGARDAVRHLVSRGHRRIACVQGREDSSVIVERVRGYREGLKEAGLRFRKNWLVGGEHSMQVARDATLALLRDSAAPTALLALSNQLALGALQAARESGVSVPERLSIITFDEQPWASLLSPPLMTIAQPVELMGVAAVDRLVDLVEKPTRRKIGPAVVKLPVKLIERGSVGAVGIL